MNKEEIKFYSIGRGNLNLDGKFYYGLDYAITDFMRNLEQENKELKAKLELYENGVIYSSENEKLHNKIDKAIDVIHTQMKNNPSYKENLKIIENNLIKGNCKVCDLKDSDVDGR